jgi:hypothetical protein
LLLVGSLVAPGRSRRREALGLLGVACLGGTVSAAAAWPYPYGQNFAAVLCCLALAVARLEGVARGAAGARFPLLAGAFAVVLFAAAGAELAHGSPLRAQLEVRQRMLALLRPGDEVILRSAWHPVTARDGSFFGNPLVDAPDRLCRAVAAARPRWPLPRCDYAQDIRTRRPAIVDVQCIGHLRRPQDAAFLDRLARDYVVVDRWLLVRRDRAEADGNGRR